MLIFSSCIELLAQLLIIDDLLYKRCIGPATLKSNASIWYGEEQSVELVQLTCRNSLYHTWFLQWASHKTEIFCGKEKLKNIMLYPVLFFYELSSLFLIEICIISICYLLRL